jgi:hypothetical protein
MTITALVLYGSCARGDNDANSDVDLFALTTEDDYRMVIKSKINLAMYPKTVAFDMAKRGELFILHVVEEGKSLMDFSGDFQLLKDSFVYRKSYGIETSKAGSLGWGIAHFGRSVGNQALVNQRIAWCVRTILIGKAAESKVAIFSARALAEFSDDSDVYKLILNKNQEKFQPSIFPIFRKFLLKWIGPAPLPEGNTLDDYRAFFKRTENVVAIKTFRAFSSDKNYDDYVGEYKKKRKAQ